MQLAILIYRAQSVVSEPAWLLVTHTTDPNEAATSFEVVTDPRGGLNSLEPDSLGQPKYLVTHHQPGQPKVRIVALSTTALINEPAFLVLFNGHTAPFAGDRCLSWNCYP